MMESHEACQDEESRDTVLFQNILSKERSQGIYKEEQERLVQEQKERVKKQEEKVQDALDSYKSILDKFPTGYIGPLI